jgi:hypothetical protein
VNIRKIRIIAPGFGFYVYNTHLHFPKQMSFLYTGGIKQIIPTKNFEDGGTSIFASAQGRYWCLPYPVLYVWYVCTDLEGVGVLALLEFVELHVWNVQISNSEVNNVLNVIIIQKNPPKYKAECRAAWTPDKSEGRIKCQEKWVSILCWQVIPAMHPLDSQN